MTTETIIVPPNSEAEKKEITSNLSPELQFLVKTAEFKKWFGDWENDPENASKVVDENGEPQLVYSGLPAGIEKLSGDRRANTGDDEIGFYFTRRQRNARSMASQRRDPLTDEYLPSSVYSAFLNVRNPQYVQRGSTRVTQPPKGHDGFVNDQLQELVVFDPNQVAIINEQPIDKFGRPIKQP